MMKKYLLSILLVLCFSSVAVAAPPAAPSPWTKKGKVVETKADDVAVKIPSFTVDTLPSTLDSGDAGSLALVTDGDDTEDCTTGGGSDKVICRWTGSAWANAGDGTAVGSAEVEDEVFNDSNFNADTSHGVSQDDFYDLWHGVDADDDGSFADETWLTDYLTEAEFTATIGSGYDEEAELDALFAAKQDAATAATDAELAALQADDLVTLSGVVIGSTHLATFTGTTIDDNQTIKQALQALETAVEAAGAADAFTVKVDAGATAGYLGAANSDGVLRTDGTIVTYADGGDFVTIGLHGYLDDIAGITAAQGDVIYFDGTDWTNLGPGLAGQYLKTGGAAANPSWDDPAGSGDITAVGDSASGASFTADGTGNVLYFEGSTANAFEIALTGANPAGDVTVTIPATTGTLLLSDGDGSALTSVDAATGDSATAFFDAGAIETEFGGTGADLSSTTGIMGINSGTYVDVDTAAELETYAGLGAFANEYLDDANAAAMLATLGIDSAANLETALSLGAYASDILGAADSDALVTLLGLQAGDIPDLSSTYEAVDAEILRADTADTIGADMEFQDNIPASFGNDNDWEIDYNTASGILAVTHTAGAAADVTFDLNDDAADSTYTITNSDGTYEANLEVEGDITATNITIDSGDGNRILTLINNTAGNQPTTTDVNTGMYSYQTDLFIVANDDIHTMFEADTGDIYLYGATGDSGYEYQIDITDPTADRTITLDNNNVDLSHTTEDYVLKYNASTRTWAGEADSTGTALGSNLSSSTNDIVSDNNSIELESNSEDIDFEFTSNTVTLTTDTGVTLFDFGTINLGTDALDLSEGNIANVGTIALDAINADATNVIFGSAAATQLQFRDSAIHIASADDGHLDLTADTSIDLNGTVVVSGTLDQNEDVDIDFDASDEEVVITNSAEYGANGAQVTIDNSDADVGAQNYLLNLDWSADDGQANADYIIAQDSGGTVWVLGQDGDVTTTDGDYTSTNGTVSAEQLTTTDDISVTDDILLSDGSVVGITGNEVITFNAAGSINVTGATMDVDGAFTASTVTSDGAVSGTSVTDGTVTLVGDGTITGVSVGGLPDNIVDNGMMADNSIDSDDYVDASIDEPHLNVTNSPTDNYVLSYNEAGTNFTWVEMSEGGTDDQTLAEVLSEGADANDLDITSVDKLEGFDAGVYIDLGADTLVEIQSDTTVQIGASDEDLQITDGGANQIDIGSGSGVDTISLGAISMVTTGTISGAISVATDADGKTISAAEGYGSFQLATGAGTWVLPAVAEGMSVCIYSTTAAAVVVDPNASDRIIYDGTAGADGENLTSASAAGDFICLIGDSADGWIALGSSGTWTPE
jgi:hypothetical protein